MVKQKKLYNPIGDQKRVQKELKDLTPEEISAMNWYYKMELKPGCFTSGFNVFINMIPTESLLKQVKFEGLRTLDIGGMECAFSVLLDRAGAVVEVYDRRDQSDRIHLVQEAYGSKFKYHTGMTFDKFVTDKVASGDSGFDFVLFSGVLYHVIDPTLFLHQIRALMRPGALMVLETSLIPDEECCIYFNEAGRFYKGTNYFQVTSSWLDYTLRLMGFKIHNANYINNKTGEGVGRDMVRCAVLVELTDEPVVGPKDRWAKRQQMDRELSEYVELPKYKRISLSDRIAREGFVKYGLSRRELLHKGTQSINLTKLLKLKKPLPFKLNSCTRNLNDKL